jgi:hypothetical protein
MAWNQPFYKKRSYQDGPTFRQDGLALCFQDGLAISFQDNLAL